MFFRLYKYSLLRSMRQKLNVFWNLVFPIILGTLFQLAFGGFLEKEVMFRQIPVAYVEGESADQAFARVLKGLEEDEKLLRLHPADAEEARQLLKDGKVKGIYWNVGGEGKPGDGEGKLEDGEGKLEDGERKLEDGEGKPGDGEGKLEDGERKLEDREGKLEDGEGKLAGKEVGLPHLSLTVSEQGINESILSTILEQYGHVNTILSEIARDRPQGIDRAVDAIARECQYVTEHKISEQPLVNTLDYFYSLLAMNCLMGATAGLICAVQFKADLSSLGARRVVSSTNRFGVLMADLLATVTVQFFYLVFSASYLIFALKVPMGDQWGFMLLALLTGCVQGISLGFFIGVAGKWQETTKEGICIMFMMASSFFSGLMMAEMRWLVEEYAPWFARINPATLIVKAFYSLNAYESYGQYAICLGSLSALSILLWAGSYMAVRRERYASI